MDSSLFRSINRFANNTAWLHGPAKAYAEFGIAVFAILLLLGWWDARGSKDSIAAVAAVGWAAVAALVGVGLVQIIGGAVDRARPTTVLHGTHLLLDPTKDFSFPSDHSTAAGAVAVGLLLAGPPLRLRWYGWVASGSALLMAFTRVYVGAHYPGDVAAGLLLGGLTAAALMVPGRFVCRKLVQAVAATPLRPLVTASEPERATVP